MRTALIPEERSHSLAGNAAWRDAWITATIWAVVLLPLGMWIFWRAEESYGRD